MARPERYNHLCAFADDMEKEDFNWERDGEIISAYSAKCAAEIFCQRHEADRRDQGIRLVEILTIETGEFTRWDMEASIIFTALPAKE